MCENYLRAFKKLTAGEHHMPAAPLAFQADIGTYAGNGPDFAAAGVQFTQFNYIANGDIIWSCHRLAPPVPRPASWYKIPAGCYRNVSPGSLRDERALQGAVPWDKLAR